jgi:exopolysaccharide biosynthesis polyprenyl glycosylphosphotransferase
MTNLFGHSVRSEGLFLYVAEAAACFAAVYFLFAWASPLGTSPSSMQEAALAALLALATGVAAGAVGMHNPEAWTRARRLATGTLFIAVSLLPLAWVAVALSGVERPSGLESFGLVELLLACAGAGAAVLTRLVFLALARTQLFSQPIAVLGGAEEGFAPIPQWWDGPTRPRAPYRIALRLRMGAALENTLSPEVLRDQRIRMLVKVDPAPLPAPIDRRLGEAGVRVVDEIEFLEQQQGRVDLSALDDDWLATARGCQEHGLEAVLRRGFDIVVSLSLLLLTLPLTLLAIVAIRLDSPGPVFYRQERVGRGGRIFLLMKLRSMRVDAESGGAPQWAVQRDPRVTRVGRILRLTRIDEIPQVLNVLRGDMAFIGPRPERPAFVEELGRVIPHYHDRQVVKPGITGWAQVNFPYGASVEDARQKLTYDLYYVRRRSLFLDLLILVSTVRVILFQEGSR